MLLEFSPFGAKIMQALIVPSSSSGETIQLLSSYVVNRTIAIDAGSLGLYGTIEQQSLVRHIFLTHCHLDHIASLPPFLDAVYDGSGNCVTIHGNAHVLEILRTDVFNNRIYPDFLKISTFRPPYLKLNEVKAGEVISVEGLRVKPVEVDHVVPTLGYVIEDERSQVVFAADSGPTQAIWDVANGSSKPTTVFMECTFPDSLLWLADIAKHLTPSTFAGEMAKVKMGSRFITVHIHPRQRATVTAELQAKAPSAEIGQFATVYDL